MDIQFFYVTEHVQNKTLSVQHCPTEEMVADFFTKPLEASLFVKLWNFIMGTEYADPDQQTHRMKMMEVGTRKLTRKQKVQWNPRDHLWGKKSVRMNENVNNRNT